MSSYWGKSAELLFHYSSAIIFVKVQRYKNPNENQTYLSVADSNDISY